MFKFDNHIFETIVEDRSITISPKAKAATKKPAAAKKPAVAKAKPTAKPKPAAKAKPTAKPAVKKKPVARKKPAARKPRSSPKKTVSAVARLLSLVQSILDDGQAQDVVVIDLAGKSTIADFMVVATGGSNRQISALSESLMRAIKTAKFGAPAVEGKVQGDWVLIDAGDIIVHLFRSEVRSFYNLEKMWEVALPDDGQTVGVGA